MSAYMQDAEYQKQCILSIKIYENIPDCQGYLHKYSLKSPNWISRFSLNNLCLWSFPFFLCERCFCCGDLCFLFTAAFAFCNFFFFKIYGNNKLFCVIWAILSHHFICWRDTDNILGRFLEA